MTEGKKDFDLLKKFLDKECSDDERRIVINWFDDKAHEQKLSFVLKRHWDELDYEHAELDETTEKILNKIHHQINIENDDKEANRPIVHKLTPKGRKWSPIRWAASIAILLVLGYIITYYGNPEKKQEFVQQNLSYIKPGKPKAVLKMNDGRTIELCKSCSVEEHEADGTKIVGTNGAISYKQDGDTESKEQLFNTLSIPRGGEFRLQLSDGTTVWLNADSEFIYPVQFQGDTRVVKLKGEAYFEVAHDASRPFQVITQDQMNITVLGTKFNVRAYPDSENSYVTLNSGSVAVTAAGEMVKVSPNEQLVYNENARRLKTRKVDASAYSAWKDGEFIFDSVTLEDLMKDLGRWYDVQTDFDTEELKHKRFTGDMKRYDSFVTVLNLLQGAEKITFEVNDKKVFIIERE